MARRRDSKGRFTKGGAMARRPRGGMRTRNVGLKSMSVAGVKVYPAAYDAAGVIVGTYFGGAVTNMASNALVGRLPAKAQGGGWAVLGIGTIMAGRFLKKKSMFEKLPVDYTFIGFSVPMFVEALRQFGAPGFAPLVVAPPAPAPDVTTEGSLRPGMGPGMGGTIRPNRLPGGGMGGTIRRGKMPAMGRTRMRMVR